MKTIIRFSLLALSLMVIVACGSSETSSNTEENMSHGEMEHDNMTHDEMEHNEGDGHGGSRIPNPDGAVIRILSPADGATFQAGEDIVVEVEIDNFEIGVDGNHWHVYVDGSSWGMVMGQNYDEVIRAIESGTHEITAYLAGGDHIEFEDGSKITITVEE